MRLEDLPTRHCMRLFSVEDHFGSTTRLRDIFMHVVLIKNTLGHEKSSMSQN